METEQAQNQVKACKEIITPLHCCLIRARAHSAGAFINYLYMQMQERANEREYI